MSQRYPGVAYTGFPEYSKKDLRVLIDAYGYSYAGGLNRNVRIVFTSREDAKVQAARAQGVRIITPENFRTELGPPLGSFLSRLKARVVERGAERAFGCHLFGVGAPADEAVLEKVEARIGFALPEAARQLWRQLEGLSMLWTISYTAGRPSPLAGTGLTPDALIPWNQACHAEGALWSAIDAHRAVGSIQGVMGLACIPPVQTIFFTDWDERMFSSSAYTDRDTIQMGRRKVKAKEFFANLFMFDLFHPYYQAGLWADREKEELSVVYGSDHGADWGVAATIPLELYMEQLLNTLGGDRIIEPTSRGGRTRAMKSYYGTTGHMVLDPFN